MTDKPREECGVFGIYSPKNTPDVVSSAFYALYALQHRGQESCGIAVCDDGVIRGYSDSGLVSDVFTHKTLSMLGGGNMAIGHVRYGTRQSGGRQNAQPITITHIKGNMAVATNGALTNRDELRRRLEMGGLIFQSDSDAELIAGQIVRERLALPSIEEAVRAAAGKLKGSYTMLVMSPTKLIACRDPFGFRPLCIGKTEEGAYVFASETCALDSVGATFLRDVLPGEILMADKNGLLSISNRCGKQREALCVFELIYFARPDSVVDGVSVNAARRRSGAFLALDAPVNADVVIGVPDSGIDAAIGYAQQSGIPYNLGFIKNKYIARTFIQPSQADREDKVRIKLNPIAETVSGKRVVIVDDSIVRGTTSARIVRLLRTAGAREVHMRVSAPPFLYPCYFGTDIDSADMLIAHSHSLEEIREIIGADTLAFNSVENIVKIAADVKKGFCTGCFSGNYPCEINREEGKEQR